MVDRKSPRDIEWEDEGWVSGRRRFGDYFSDRSATPSHTVYDVRHCEDQDGPLGIW